MFIHLPRRRRRPVVNTLRHRLAGLVVALGCALIPPADAQPGTPATPSRAGVVASVAMPGPG